MRILNCLIEDHNYFLTALAAVICIFGSAITVRFYQRVANSPARARLPWAFLGAVAGGATIWCTHFVAMLAYQSGVNITYAPVLTGASLVIAVTGCVAALWIGSLKHRYAREMGGALFGLTVTAMHYTGMSAFTAEALLIWHYTYVAASVLIALVIGAVSFRVAASPSTRNGMTIASGLMVLTIVGLHFTGMGALEIMPLAPAEGAMTGDSASHLMAYAVAGVGLLILAVAMASNALEAQTSRVAANRLHDLIEGSVDGMIVERDGVILLANASFAHLCGTEPKDLIGTPLSQWVANVETAPHDRLCQREIKASDGATAPVEIAIRPQHDEYSGATMRVIAVRDLRNRIAQERRIAHLARNDILTDLPNRSSFLEKLERQCSTPDASQPFALLSIDLDRFKEVNDFHGHAMGDALLRHVAAQMRSAMQPGEFIARLGGDEFVAIIPVADRAIAYDRAEKLREAIITPTTVEHLELQCGASIGIALWPENAQDTATLINNSDLAMYRAKSSLGSDICFYEEAMDLAVRHRRRLIQGLREALDQNQFELHYQVQASLSTNETTGYEALLRWRQPDGGFISPAEFIPLAEETGLILPLGEWVLRQACSEAARWPEPHRVAVNLSPVQLSHVDLPRLVHQILIETGLAPQRLELEITETAMITDMDRTTHILRQLKLLGVTVAMDDFGTGYSSLSTLRAFPFDKIKLDRSFMLELDDSPQSRAIIRAVLALGQSLNIPVLAEGVETQPQMDFLREQGCHQAQGYLLGRPSRISADEPPQREDITAKASGNNASKPDRIMA